MALSSKIKAPPRPRRPSGLGLVVLIAPVIISLLYVNMALTVADGLFIKPGPGELSAFEPKPDDPGSRQRLVRIDLARLTGANGDPAERIPLNLFENVFFTAVREKYEIDDGGLVWQGHLDAVPNSRVIFVLLDDSLAGNIYYPGVGFLIQSLENGLHLIKEIKPEAANKRN